MAAASDFDDSKKLRCVPTDASERSGAENGRAWSMVIDQISGDMTAAIAGDETGFVLFGVCQKY